MARVILIDPPGWQGAAEGQQCFPNVGLAYLVPPLLQGGHEVAILDLNNQPLTEEQILARLEQFAPDLIAFSVKTATMKAARRLGEECFRKWPQVPILLGGPHVTIAWRELAHEPWIRQLFLGEGELEIASLCDRLTTETAGSKPKVVGRPTAAGEPAPFHVPDLEALSPPNFQLFPAAVRKAVSASYPLVTSRGCAFRCTYCSVPHISGRRFRKRSPEHVVAELKAARQSDQIQAFEIIDDSFNLDLEHCKRICSAIIAADLHLPWACHNGIRVDRVDEELARLMKRAGCETVMVGVESADPAVFAGIGKGETLEQIERGIRVLQGAGMAVGGYFIIGLPGDSLAAEARSVEFVRRLGITAHFNMFVPYPGTALWDWVRVHGRFLAGLEEGRHFADTAAKAASVFETPEFSAAQRRQAYEMVHARLGRFDLLIDKHSSRWQFHRQALRMLWRHDRGAVPVYLQSRLKNWRRRLVGGDGGTDRKEA